MKLPETFCVFRSLRNIRRREWMGHGWRTQGFALISVIIIMSLIVVISLGLLSVSRVEVRNSNTNTHQLRADANARMALQLALAKLQEEMGPDQRVSANARILDSMTHANWVGVWDSTYEEMPLVGKNMGDGGDSLYSVIEAYSDLRSTHEDLMDGHWKEETRRGWLVSGGGVIGEGIEMIEMLGEGSLGEVESVLEKYRVEVPKVDLVNGGYAWWVCDQNQKASISPNIVDDETREPQKSLDLGKRISMQDRLDLLTLEDGSYPYEEFADELREQGGKIQSYKTLEVTEVEKMSVREHSPHLTYSAYGLFVDTTLGGLKKDLTPLLFGMKSSSEIEFIHPDSAEIFSSSAPMIPSARHAVLSPSYDALRDWGLKKYRANSDELDAETTFLAESTRMREVALWPHGVSDGVTFESSQWASGAPKIHPLMTDSRWHYYFSAEGQNIRTHIIPRVCLWNPYNVRLKMPDLVAMMPNPFFNAPGGFHFYVNEGEVERLREEFEDETSNAVHQWIKKGTSPLEDQFKIRLQPHPVSGRSGLFPDQRYLAFVLEGTMMEPGECHVFSPKLTNVSVSSEGIGIAEYNEKDVSANVLSSSSSQGSDHFYHDHLSTSFEIQATSWRKMTSAVIASLDFTQIHDYRAEIQLQSSSERDNFPFILKSANSSPTDIVEVQSSTGFPTLQLILNGNGGVAASDYFGYLGSEWGSANTVSSFGPIQTFQNAPSKDAPATHQVGAKLLWLDESQTESLDPPLRVGRWVPEHMVFHPSLVGNWNIRAHLTTRSPVSQCSEKWYMTSTGPWLMQFSPKSPRDMNDMPILNQSGSAFVKNPFGLSNKFSHSPNAVLFELPDSEIGSLSMGNLRHAMLSPYSWHPSYVVGHSLRDLHAPAESTAHAAVTSEYMMTNPANAWDYLIGGFGAYDMEHGPRADEVDSSGLLQIGKGATTKEVDGRSFSSENEILAYDIAYEVNHHVWDQYFLSSMPLDEESDGFDWDPREGDFLANSRYSWNPHAREGRNLDQLIEGLKGSEALSKGFWKNSYYLRNNAAFNINSTSIEAWTALLCGTLEEDNMVNYSRFSGGENADFTKSEDAHPDSVEGWMGKRKLTEDEIKVLAEHIVDEVKLRGPFYSLSDFVNRRLTDETDETSRMGAMDAAIMKAGLNAAAEEIDLYDTTIVNSGDNDAPDNNLQLFRENYLYKDGSGQMVSSQPASKVWGFPSFLTQSDLLEAIAPSLSARGDTFTIRAYGESKDLSGKVMATSWVEAVVTRTPDYIDKEGNNASDSVMIMDPYTGEVSDGELSDVNKKFGRRFIILSTKFLSKNEI